MKRWFNTTSCWYKSSKRVVRPLQPSWFNPSSNCKRVGQSSQAHVALITLAAGQSFGLIAHLSCLQQKFNEQVILYSNADFIAPRASGPLVLVWSSHLASCWLCAHHTVTARMSRLTLHACLARYSQKPKFNSIIWGWEVSGHGEAQQLQPILFLQNSSNGRIASHCWMSNETYHQRKQTRGGQSHG